MLAIDTISAGYHEKLVLDQVSVDVARGEFLGVIGPNGCGKTTLLRVVSGVLATTGGQVRLNDTDIRSIPRRDMAKVVTCLSQDLDLEFPFTIREVVFMGRTPHLPRIGRETKRDWEVVEHAMDVADIASLADRPITEVSGGERQRAFIAMCLAQEPQLLLLDEPTTHLDIGHQLSILQLIRDLNRQTGLTVVAVFHDLNLASEFCEQLLVLNQGKVEALGPPKDVLTEAMIRRVYGATIRTEQNPVSHKPHVVIAADVQHPIP